MANKHTSGAALCYAILFAIEKIGPVWFPGKASEFKQTSDVLKEIAVVYGFSMAGDAGKKQDNPPDETSDTTPPMKKLPLLIVFGALILSAGCGGGKLEPGGAYAPVTTNVTVNADGTMTTNVVATQAADPAFLVADNAYKLAYDTVDGVLKTEADNRALIANQFPGIKPALDKIRPVVWDIDQRWARARKAYKANPTAPGLTGLQSILAEMQRLQPVAQSQIAPFISAQTAPLK